MNDLMKPDRSCVPYSRKGTYLLITIPMMILIIIVFLYLLSVNILYGLIYAGFWLLANVFQSYCCAYQECPYTDEFCPAVIGIVPASRIANLSFIRGMKKTQSRFDLFATFGSLCLAGLILFPLVFLFELGIIFPVGYLLLVVIYACLFLWYVCPVCAIKGTCPGGRASTWIRESIFKK